MGRDLHKALEVNSNYTTWFNRMSEYGFTEGVDFITIWSDSKNGNAAAEVHSPQKMAALSYELNHQLAIDMAKEICMIQRSDIGRKCRQYFIEVEKQWNTPEAVMARALKIANNKIGLLEGTVKEQQIKIDVLNKENDILSANKVSHR